MAELKRVTNRGDNFNELKYYTFDKNKPPILKVEMEEKFVADCRLIYMLLPWKHNPTITLTMIDPPTYGSEHQLIVQSILLLPKVSRCQQA